MGKFQNHWHSMSEPCLASTFTRQCFITLPTQTCTILNIHACIQTHTCVSTCMHTDIQKHLHTRSLTHIYKSTHTFMHTKGHMHTRELTHTYACTHIRFLTTDPGLECALYGPEEECVQFQPSLFHLPQ